MGASYPVVASAAQSQPAHLPASFLPTTRTKPSKPANDILTPYPIWHVQVLPAACQASQSSARETRVLSHPSLSVPWGWRGGLWEAVPPRCWGLSQPECFSAHIPCAKFHEKIPCAKFPVLLVPEHGAMRFFLTFWIISKWHSIRGPPNTPGCLPAQRPGAEKGQKLKKGFEGDE